MSVYIDDAYIPFNRMKMCHMIADTQDELHEMAKMIGMKLDWFQEKSFPHYDVCVSRRKVAVSLGAIELTQRELVLKIKELRNENINLSL